MSERFFDGLRRTLGENLRFASIALRAHKLRAFLTIVGIVIGVWTVIAMVALVTGFNRSTMEAFSSFGTTLVQFQKFEPRFFGGGHRPPEEERNRKVLDPLRRGRGAEQREGKAGNDCCSTQPDAGLTVHEPGHFPFS